MKVLEVEDLKKYSLSYTCDTCIVAGAARPFRVWTTSNRRHAALVELHLHTQIKHAA